MPDRRFHRPLIFLALATALSVTACNKPGDATNATAAANGAPPLPTLPATLPMATGAATAAVYAPAVGSLPAARRIRTVRVANSGDDYAYADDAYAFSHAVGNAPPDYGFDYQGTEPWAWQGYDESRTFVEPVANGYRYYYYRPGADTPYFVRDPDYGYGYDDGSLAVIYGAGGAILPFAQYGPRLGYASRYLQRGEDLYQASRGNERRAVIAANWAARQDAIAASRDRWAAAEAQQAGWQAYRARVADRQAEHWVQEAARRDADAQRFATWHDDGFRSVPPPRAIPVAWQRAPWAQDQLRYRVVDRGTPQPFAATRPAEQRPVDAGRPGAPSQGFSSPPQQASAPRFPDARGPGTPDIAGQQRAAAEAARAQSVAMQARHQQAVQASDQQQREARDAQQHAAQLQAATVRSQQQAAHAQQQQATRQAQQAERQQQAAADRQQQDAARQTQRQQQAVVRVHRGDDVRSEADAAPRGPQRQSLPPPSHDDQHQADRQQQQAMHQAQQAAHQQDAAEHRQQAAVQHAAAPPPPRAQPQPHAAPAPHPAPAPHAAPAPHPNGGDHGGHLE